MLLSMFLLVAAQATPAAAMQTVPDQAASAQTATVQIEPVPAQEINYKEGQLGFAAMRAGENDRAIAELERAAAQLPNDPARLINLGNAYARVGRFEEARATLRLAVSAQEHFDLILADGRVVDSRQAAIYALDRLDGRTPTNVASGR